MHPHRSPWWSLPALCLPMLIASMDVSVLFFAVPDITKDLNPTAQQQLWIFDIYGLMVAGLLLTMGSIADRIGHRRLLIIGAVAFSAASVVAACASSALMLIGARAALGVAGATLMPSTLALIRHIFTDDKERTRAIGMWSAVMASGVALGPIISGLLLEQFWWGSVFLINVPAMVLLLITAPVLLPGDTADSRRRIDVLSSVLALSAILPIAAAIKSMGNNGLTTLNAVAVAVGSASTLAFLLRQKSLAFPLIDIRLLRQRAFGTSIIVNLIAAFGLLGNAILVTQYLQSVLGYSPLAAALWSLAPALIVGAVVPSIAAISTAIGRPAALIAALTAAAGGFLVISTAATTSSLWIVLLGSTMIAGGLVSVSSLVADHIVSCAPPEHAGTTAGLLETTSELGGAVGIAVLGTIASSIYRSSLTPEVKATNPAASRSFADGLVHSPTAQASIRDAYVSGLQYAAGCACAVIVGAVILVVMMRKASAQEAVITHQ